MDLGWPIFGENLQTKTDDSFLQDEEIIVFLAALRTEGIYSEWFRYILTLPEQEANNSLSWNPEEAGVLRIPANLHDPLPRPGCPGMVLDVTGL